MLDRAVWETAELPALIDGLARRTGIPRLETGPVHAPISGSGIAVWIENTCAHMGIDMDAVEVWGFRVEENLRAAPPAIVPVESGWIALVDVHRERATVLAPDLSLHRIPLEQLRSEVARGIEEPFRVEVDSILGASGIEGKQRMRAAAALMRERSRHKRAGILFQLRVSPGASFWLQCRQAGLHWRIALLLASHMAEYVLWIVSWYILGSDALQGHADAGWLAGWMLILASLVPFRMLTTWFQGVVAISAGGLLRQRVLAGILKLSPEDVRHEGAGRFLARSIEAGAVESLALSGGLMSGLAVLEMGLALIVLAQGAAAMFQAPLLVLWAVLAIWLALRYWSKRSLWTGTRLSMTHDLVERMTGHRTRIAQEPPSQWHVDEDRQMDEYVARSQAMDAASARLLSLVPSGWMVAGIASLAPAFLSSSATSASLAVSIGGTLLAWRSLRRFVSGAGNLSGAAISWRQISLLFHAAARPEQAGSVPHPPEPGEVVIDARDLVFRRAKTGRSILDGVDLELRRGERILIEGPSGGGKSTLVSLLSGMRDPTAGLILSGGVDRRTLGDTLWRARIAAAPQYHENHVLSGPFAYNLLMGRQWPAPPELMEEAQELCTELGLGPLLERMPGGLMQMVGETGWQLSQGERSRLFMARALLQSPEVVVLDESFAALDPENLRQALECVLRRAPTLVVVAHP